MKLLDFIKIPKGESMIQDMMSTLERHINYRERRAYSTPFGQRTNLQVPLPYLLKNKVRSVVKIYIYIYIRLAFNK